MFPVWANELLVFSVFWISGHDEYGRSALLIVIYSTTRNTGNIRNSVGKTQVGLGFPMEQTGNTPVQRVPRTFGRGRVLSQRRRHLVSPLVLGIADGRTYW